VNTVNYRYLILHVAALITLLLIGWLTQAWSLCLAAYLVVVIAWHSRHLLILRHWLDNPNNEPPAAWGLTQEGGLWRSIFEHLFRQQKRHQKLQNKLRLGLEEYRNATESFPEPVITLDENRHIVWLNAAASQVLGLRKPDDIGQPLSENGVLRPIDIESPQDNNIKLNVRMFNLSDRRYLLLFRNVTQLRNVEAVRRDFVANVSHELRTPLTVLIGYLESLADDSQPELRLITDRMYEQTRSMRTLIDDLIEISRLQGQDISSPESNVNINAMLAQLREQTDSLNNKQHKISFSCDTEYQIKGVEKDLESAFSNLITNAIRYTPDNGTIHISWAECETGAMLSVSDNGLGIPREDIPRLTERFYRVAKDRSRASGGSGLGLSIVKHVLNAHDAHLEISSELGVGSQFSCIFPTHRLLEGKPESYSLSQNA